MRFTQALWQQRQPLIKFLGKRSTPTKMDHTPKVHPASPDSSLPDSFASYRQSAQQHGPLRSSKQSSPSGRGLIGGQSGSALGPVVPEKGQYFDRDELPARFRRTPFTQAEMDAIDSAGASMFA